MKQQKSVIRETGMRPLNYLRFIIAVLYSADTCLIIPVFVALQSQHPSGSRNRFTMYPARRAIILTDSCRDRRVSIHVGSIECRSFHPDKNIKNCELTLHEKKTTVMFPTLAKEGNLNYWNNQRSVQHFILWFDNIIFESLKYFIRSTEYLFERPWPIL